MDFIYWIAKLRSTLVPFRMTMAKRLNLIGKSSFDVTGLFAFVTDWRLTSELGHTLPFIDQSSVKTMSGKWMSLETTPSHLWNTTTFAARTSKHNCSIITQEEARYKTLPSIKQPSCLTTNRVIQNIHTFRGIILVRRQASKLTNKQTNIGTMKRPGKFLVRI